MPFDLLVICGLSDIAVGGHLAVALATAGFRSHFRESGAADSDFAQRIDSANCVIAVWSRHARKEGVPRIAERALLLRKPVILALIEDTKLPDNFARYTLVGLLG